MNRMQAWSGMFAVSSLNGLVSPDYSVFVPTNEPNICVRFFLYFFRTPQLVEQFAKQSKGIGSGFNRLYTPDFGSVLALAPPISEQTAIVRFLDHADRRIQRYIRVKQKLIGLLEEQKQAIIHQSVTGRIDVRTGQPYPAYKPSGVEWLGDVPTHWKARRLRNLVVIRVSNVDKHTRNGENLVRLCNYVDVYNNEFIDQHMNFMLATATRREIKRFRLKREDVLITKDSESWNDIAVPALVTETASDLVCGYHLALLRPRLDELVGSYLLRSLQSKGVCHQFHIEAKGVTRYGLTHNGIKSVWLPLPPLSEQSAIAHFLDATTVTIDDVIARAKREINLLQEYRTRLVADVVTGKLDVRAAAATLPEVDPLAGEDNLNDTLNTGSESDIDELDVILEEAEA